MSAILAATDITVRFNDRMVLDHASLTLEERARIGMVGRNGSGKSTFLKILAGLQPPDLGEVTQRRDLVIGYLPQESALDPALTVAENIRAGARHVLELIREFEALPATSKKHVELEQRILTLDGWGLDHRIATAMEHLNCPAGERAIGALSGGEQRRVALCRAIIARPDLLILDEPTNHLDTDSIEWVAEYLEGYPGTFLLATHDRYFLDRITNTIVELANGNFYSYTGNYTAYLVARAEREANLEVAEHKRQMFLRRELEWVRRGPQARTTKSKSRLERFYDVADQGPPDLDGEVDLLLPPPPPLANRVSELVNVGMELGGQQLFSNLNFTFTAGQRVGITGRNGLGKTTLLRIILGQLEPTAGTVKSGPQTRFNYVDQGRIQLDDEHTVLEAVSEGASVITFGEQRLSVRAYLKRFLFADERISALVKNLSGGERSRLLLARILKNGGNFLILDEPTNDLDLATLRVLEEALVTFAGVVLVVSHDRYFLNRVCTDILAFEGAGRVVHSVGNYDYYAEKRQRIQAATSVYESAASMASPGDPDAQASEDMTRKPARARRLTFKESSELTGMEAAILAAEQDVARLEALFASPDYHRQHGQRTQEFTTELAAARERVALLYERWQELEAIRATAAPGVG